MNKSFYTSKRWRRKREYILHRDKHLCQVCKHYGKNTEAKIVHHIIEVEDQPELKMKDENLISVCPSCHNKQHPEKGGHKIRY